MDAKCKTCGSTFSYEPKANNSQRYKCDACRNVLPGAVYVCSFCQKEFKARRGNANKHCSHACYLAQKRTYVVVACARCGKECRKHPRRPGSYCSMACYKPVTQVTKPCKTCGAPFAVKLGQSKKAFYCSTKCVTVAKVAGKLAASPPPSINGAVWIPLSRGAFALVDDVDAEFVGQFNWALHKPKNMSGNGYAVSTGGVKRAMHRMIFGDHDGLEVDHIDGNSLDNRRANLRAVTPAQQSYNRVKHSNSKRSSYKGVSHDGCKWFAMFGGVSIGRVDTELEAAHLYDAKAREHHGVFGRYNFPRPGEQDARFRGNFGGPLVAV